MSLHRVLVTAVGGNVGQGVIKGLRSAKRDFHITGIDIEKLSAGFYMVDAYYCPPQVTSPAFEPFFENLVRNENIEAVYVCSHAELEYFSTNQQKLEKKLGIKIFVNPPKVVGIGADKFETANFLKNAGFPHPATALASDTNAVNELIEKVGFPLIMKPRLGFSSHNVFKVNSIKEIKAVNDLVSDVVVQQYIATPADEYTATTISNNSGKVVASIVLHRDLVQGTTYRTELLQDDGVTDQLVKTANYLGAVGVCNFQFRISGDTIFVFEINPRFSGSGGIRYLYGFNDAELVFELLKLGMDIRQPELSGAVVLRYWNEVLIPDMTFNDIRNGKTHSGTTLADNCKQKSI